jgi:hypothetical protein
VSRATKQTNKQQQKTIADMQQTWTKQNTNKAQKIQTKHKQNPKAKNHTKFLGQDLNAILVELAILLQQNCSKLQD